MIGFTNAERRKSRSRKELQAVGKLRVSYSVYKNEGELVLYAEHLLTALYRNPANHTEALRAKAAEKEAAHG